MAETTDRSQTPGWSVPSHEGSPSKPGGDLGPGLLERVRRREPQALEAFFETYFDRIHAFVRRLLGDASLAEDVTQDVFLKIYKAADRIDPERDPVPWLFAIAHNACRDVWRSGAYRLARRASSIEGSPALEQSLPTAGTPEGNALAAERERLVQDAILKLPEALRAPVLMHDYQGLGHEEIAAALGIHYAAARKRYSRALVALGKMLSEKLG